VTDGPYPVVTGAVQAAAIRRRIRIPLRFADGTALHLNGTNGAYLDTKARRGGHNLLAQSLEVIETESAP
jgi:hypothetical protein